MEWSGVGEPGEEGKERGDHRQGARDGDSARQARSARGGAGSALVKGGFGFGLAWLVAE